MLSYAGTFDRCFSRKDTLSLHHFKISSKLHMCLRSLYSNGTLCVISFTIPIRLHQLEECFIHRSKLNYDHKRNFEQVGPLATFWIKFNTCRRAHELQLNCTFVLNETNCGFANESISISLPQIEIPPMVQGIQYAPFIVVFNGILL